MHLRKVFFSHVLLFIIWQVGACGPAFVCCWSWPLSPPLPWNSVPCRVPVEPPPARHYQRFWTAFVGSLSVYIISDKSLSFPFPIPLPASSLPSSQVDVKAFVKISLYLRHPKMNHPLFEKIQAIQNGYKAACVTTSHFDNTFSISLTGQFSQVHVCTSFYMEVRSYYACCIAIGCLKLRNMSLQFCVSVNIDLHYPCYWLIKIFLK